MEVSEVLLRVEFLFRLVGVMAEEFCGVIVY